MSNPKITIRYKNKKGEVIYETTPHSDTESAMERVRWLTVNGFVQLGTIELLPVKD